MRREVIGNAELWLGDCREVLPSLRVDHCISDPPYEDELHQAMGRIRRSDGQPMITSLGFDGINADRTDIARMITQCSDGWGIVFCLAEGVRAWRDDFQSAGAKYDTCLAWVKPDAMPRFNGQGASRGFECAVTVWCGRGYRSWNGGGRRGVFTHCVNTNRHGEHPTEKPVPLLSELVMLYSVPGQTILDPFMGSGTTGVACARLGRRFIGIEIEPKYYEIAYRRIEQAYRQKDLFISESADQKPEQLCLGSDV